MYCATILFLIVLALNIFSNVFIQPYHRGFFCNDQAIRHPKLNHEIVSVYSLVFICTLPSIITILSVHAFLRYNQPVHSRDSLKTYLSKILNHGRLYFTGLLLTNLLVTVAKFTIGRPRPNFYSVCQPLVFVPDDDNNPQIGKWLDCEKQNKYGPMYYFQNYNCTGADYSQDVHLSFMSGHSALSAFAMYFIILYLDQMTKFCQLSRDFKYLKTLLDTMLISFAAFVAFTRISDYMHHPTDALTGFIFGILFAYFIIDGIEGKSLFELKDIKALNEENRERQEIHERHERHERPADNSEAMKNVV